MYQNSIADKELRNLFLESQDNYSSQSLVHEINLVTSFICRHLQTLPDPQIFDKTILRLIEAKRKLVESENRRDDLQLKLGLMKQKFEYDKAKKPTEEDITQSLDEIVKIMIDVVPEAKQQETIDRLSMCIARSMSN